MRSMLVNLFFQVVIFLYLADNDTTYMILVTNAIGLAIEVSSDVDVARRWCDVLDAVAVVGRRVE